MSKHNKQIKKADTSSAQTVIPTKELGRSGLNQQGGVIYEEFLRQLQSDTLRNRIYKEMVNNEPVVAAILFVIDMLIRSVDWHAKEANDSAQAIEAKELLDSCLDDMSMSWADTLSEICSFVPFGYCLPGDQVILDGGGKPKPIKNVIEGEEVLTKYGRARKVLHKFERAYDGELISFNILGHPFPIRMTPEHLLPTQRGWLQAKDIKEGDELFRPRLQLEEGGDYLSGWHVGVYLAEGNRNNNRSRISFSIHKNETAELAANLARWAEANNLEPHHHLATCEPYIVKHPPNGAVVNFSHPRFKELIDEWVPQNTYSGTKCLSKLPNKKEFARGVWEGWLWGDGHDGIDGSGYRQSSGATISERLAYQMHIIGAALGMPSPLRYKNGGNATKLRGLDMVIPPHYNIGALPERRTIWKRTPELEQEVVRLRSAGLSMQNIAEKVGLSYLTVWRWLHSEGAKPQGLQCRIYDEVIGHPVIGIGRESFSGKVYDLEVEEDHSFCAGAVIVSNSFHEIVYKYRNGQDKLPSKKSKHTDGKLGWRKLPGRSQDSLTRWEFDDEGGISAYVQTPPPEYKEITIPIEKGLLFRTSAAKNNPEGKSILRTAYIPFYYKKRIQTYEAMGIERDLAGFPVLYVPQEWTERGADGNATQSFTDAKDFVVNIKRDEQEGAVLPSIYDENKNQLLKLELLSTGGKRNFDTRAVINGLNKEIAMTVLADFLLLGSDKVGSFALVKGKTNLFVIAITTWIDSIADIFNRHAIPRLMELNGVDLENCPTLEHDPIESEDLQIMSAFIDALSKVGVDMSDLDTQNYLRRIGGMPEITEEQHAESQANKQPVNTGIDPVTGEPIEPPKDVEALAKKAEQEDEFIKQVRELIAEIKKAV